MKTFSTQENKNYTILQIYGVCFFRQLESGSIEIHSPELNEQLSLSTADLRFADYLINHVKEYVEKGEQEAGKFRYNRHVDTSYSLSVYISCIWVLSSYFQKCILCTLQRSGWYIVRLVRIGWTCLCAPHAFFRSWKQEGVCRFK